MSSDDFEVSFEDCSSYSGQCFNCNEEINKLDGIKYIEVRVPEQPIIKFHYNCYTYFVDALDKFREIFIDEESKASRDESGFKRDGTHKVH